jgi:SAM-dependent methyltransferase
MGTLGNPVHALGKFLGTNSSVSGDDPPVHGVIAALDLEPDTVVVEIGAGVGHYTIPIAHWLDSLGGGGLVFGLDIAHALTNRLERAMLDNDLDHRIRPLPLPQSLEGELPIRDAVVDRVLAVNSAHYLEDPAPVYREISRILKPGGFALLADWRRDDIVVPDARTGQEVTLNSVALDVLGTGTLVPTSIQLPGYRFALRALRRFSEPLEG